MLYSLHRIYKLTHMRQSDQKAVDLGTIHGLTPGLLIFVQTENDSLICFMGSPYGSIHKLCQGY